MECPKCTEEIEPKLLNEWTQYGGNKVALYQCPKCETRFRQGKDNAVEFENFVAEHKVVEEWMTGRPENTRKAYARNLMKFCEAVNLTPEGFQNLSAKEAREKAWMYLSTLKNKPSVYISVLSAVKSFFRNRDGEVLTFDSRRGGKHYCNTKRVKRASYEHIPNLKEMYKIIDMASGLRDKAILTLLFQSGIRINALTRLTVGMVRKQLEENKCPLRLRITDEIDTKMQGYGITYYDTFVGRERIELLKEYFRKIHSQSEDTKRLFALSNNKPVSRAVVYTNFKKCVEDAGFNRKEITIHTIRKAFKRVVRNTNLDDEYKEAIMGHVLQGSRENYFSRNDPTEIENAYKQINFSREDGRSTEHVQQIALLQEQLKNEQQKTDGIGEYLDSLQEQIEKLQKQLIEMKNGESANSTR